MLSLKYAKRPRGGGYKSPVYMNFVEHEKPFDTTQHRAALEALTAHVKSSTLTLWKKRAQKEQLQ